MGTEDWQVVDGNPNKLTRTFTFDDFVTALAFVNKVGALAEELNHHPDLTLSWGKVTMVTWSHDVGDVTDRDYKLAAAAEDAYTR